MDSLISIAVLLQSYLFYTFCYKAIGPSHFVHTTGAHCNSWSDIGKLKDEQSEQKDMKEHPHCVSIVSYREEYKNLGRKSGIENKYKRKYTSIVPFVVVCMEGLVYYCTNLLSVTPPCVYYKTYSFF